MKVLIATKYWAEQINIDFEHYDDFINLGKTMEKHLKTKVVMVGELK